MTSYDKIDRAAHEGAFGHNALREPTRAMLEAGNYKKGRASVRGIPIVIENPRGTLREWQAADGTSGANLMKFHYGYFEGVKGADGDELDCYVGPIPESNVAYVINQNLRGAFDEHKVMLGFPDQRTAEAGYLSNFNSGWPGLQSCVPCSIAQLKWWMANGDVSKPLTPDQLPYDGRNDMDKVLWDSTNQPRGMTIARLLYNIRSHDARDGLMFEPLTVDEILADSDGVLAFDALVIPYAKLEPRMAILQKVMDRAVDGLNVTAMQVTEPFSQKGTTNVAAVFELSDGQTLAIFFHNPDVTPKKIMPGDDVISWKWLLNKKDVTIAVAPERGRDLNVRTVAMRVMMLAAKNSARFAASNSKRVERMQTIDGLKQEFEQKEQTLDALTTEIGELETALAAKPPKVIDPAPAPDPQPEPDPVIEPVLTAEDRRSAWRASLDAQDTPTVTHDGREWYVLSLGAKGEPGSDNDGKVFAHLASMSSGVVQANGWNPSQINDWIADPAAPVVAVEPVAPVEPDTAGALPTAEDEAARVAAETQAAAEAEADRAAAEAQATAEAEAEAARAAAAAQVPLEPVAAVTVEPVPIVETPAAIDPAVAAPVESAPDITYRAVDDMFTGFYAETPAGEEAWKRIAEMTDGTGKVLHQQVEGTITQLREAGYTVAEASAPAQSADDLLAALTEPQAAAQVDPEGIAAAPAADPMPEPDAAPVMPTVPDDVRQSVEFALETLREIRTGVDAAATLEKTIGGKGRYQADALTNRKADIERAKKKLALFRLHAPENGIDAEAFINELGGEPDLTPSPEALEWMNPAATPVDPEPAAVAVEPVPAPPVAGPEAPIADPHADALAYLRSVADGTRDLSDASIPGELKALYEVNKDDSEFFDLFKQAANAYKQFALAKARTVIQAA